MTRSIIPTERIERAILLIRGQKVMLDEDLADLYGVETRILVRNVKRNLSRFPEDFMFQLAKEEWDALRSHFGIPNKGRGGRRYAPYAFTEHGTVMLANVLNSPRAIEVSIQIVRAFTRQRQMLTSNEALARKLHSLEKKYDKRFRVVFEAIRQLMKPPEKGRRPIGFQVKESKKKK